MTEYEIYALKYAGPFTSSGAFLMWFKEWDRIGRRNYYFWCVRGGDETVVVDTGVSPELAAPKNLKGYVSPTDVLAGIDIMAEEVAHVVVTHIHWDHAGGVSLFPNARFYVQKQEYDFWIHDPISQRPPFLHVADEKTRSYLAALEGTERLVLIDGDRQILPGIDCLLAPGHTVALQALAVNTRRGTAVLGSDAAHIFRNYREDWPSAIVTDMVAWMRTYDKLKAKVSSMDLLFPGHDTEMESEYPGVAAGVTRLV